MVNTTTNFIKTFSFENRLKEAGRIKLKYPDRIPIIVEISDTDKKNITLDKKKYLVPQDLSIAQFIYVLRKRINLKQEEALFIFFNNKLMASSCLISEIYKNNKNSDNFLYAIISLESTFG